MKIKYKNACSVRDAELNFEKGKIYLIRGHNNSGKSSLFYTMASAMLNTKETKNYSTKLSRRNYVDGIENKQ